METIKRARGAEKCAILAPAMIPRTEPAFSLHPPRPGDIGWVISRHGALYASEYRFNAKFEALVAQVAGEFLASHDPATERCWIARAGEKNLGSIFLVRKTAEDAKLRLLLVDPEARGTGLGRHLVRTCIATARDLGYRRLHLWTNDILLAARGIYRAEGFRLTASAPHSDFGPACIGEDWLLDL